MHPITCNNSFCIPPHPPSPSTGLLAKSVTVYQIKWLFLQFLAISSVFGRHDNHDLPRSRMLSSVCVTIVALIAASAGVIALSVFHYYEMRCATRDDVKPLPSFDHLVTVVIIVTLSPAS